MKTTIINILIAMHLGVTIGDYWTDRNRLIEDDRQKAIGANIILTENEQRINDILMNYKVREYEEGFKHPSSFLAQQHFFKAKEQIENSKIFNLIKRLPKGASLHSHDEALVSQEYLFNLTFHDNLYGCVQGDNILFHFFSKNNISDSCNWCLVSDLRRRDSKFDDFLKEQLTVVRNDPERDYPDINSVWSKFRKTFRTVGGLITYKPVFEDYFYQALKELYEDNVKYMELRGFLPKVYDLEGNTYSEVEVVGMYFQTLKRFKLDHPDFYGAKFIYAPSRLANNNTMEKYTDVYKRIKQKYPHFVIGFDLVGQEDLGNPLSDYIPQLMEIKELGAKFYFHAGETNWYGETTDTNLFDAILLNVTRIGHGYALLKHPTVAHLVKERKIAVEVCPISNQVLKLLTDLRNHPGTFMMANGFPVVIASDDPSFWGAKGLSYDWYMAFMAMSSKESDLRFLKQLAMNSIEYSSLDENEKAAAMSQWQYDWKMFVNKMLKQSS